MIPEHVLQAAKTIVERSPVDALPQAFRTLREHTGLTQNQFARKLHVQRSSIANWETGLKIPVSSRTASILQAANLSEQFNQLVSSDRRNKLDAAAYRLNDADSLEYDFFISTRGQVLEKVRSFAETGNMQAARLYMDWMYRNEQRIAARASGAVPVSDSSQSLRQRAIQATSGTSRRSVEPQPVVDNEQRHDNETVTPLEQPNE